MSKNLPAVRGGLPAAQTGGGVPARRRQRGTPRKERAVVPAPRPEVPLGPSPFAAAAPPAQSDRSISASAARVPAAAAKMTLDAKELSRALRVLVKGTERRGHFANVLFREGELITTDGETTVVARVSGARELETTVPAALLQKAVTQGESKGRGRPILIDEKSGAGAILVNGKVLRGSAATDFPTLVLPPQKRPTVAAHELLDLTRVLVAVADLSPKMPGLEGVWFQLCTNHVTGCDGHRLHQVGRLRGIGHGDFLLLKKAVRLAELARSVSRAVLDVEFFGECASFSTGPFSIHTRPLPKGTHGYPAIDQVIPASSRHTIRVHAAELMRALREARPILDMQRLPAIDLRRVAAGLHVSATNPDVGEFETTLPCTGWELDAATPAAERAVRLNAGYLEQALTAAGFDPACDEECVMRYNSAKEAVCIERGDFLAVITPMLIDPKELEALAAA